MIPINRIPAKKGFWQSAILTGAGVKATGAVTEYHIEFTEPVAVVKGEWIEIDSELMTCRLCAELNGVRVSRKLDGKWTVITTECEAAPDAVISVGTVSEAEEWEGTP